MNEKGILAEFANGWRCHFRLILNTAVVAMLIGIAATSTALMPLLSIDREACRELNRQLAVAQNRCDELAQTVGELRQLRRTHVETLVLQPHLAFRTTTLQTVPVHASEYELVISSLTGLHYHSRGRTGTIISR